MRYNATVQALDAAPTDTVDWETEELTEIQHVGVPSWSNRWLGVVIAVAVAVVGFGFAGRWSNDGTTVQPAHVEPTSTTAPTEAHAATIDPASFELTSPAAGAILDDSVVRIRGIAGRALGTVHMAVWLGDAVLGWTNVEVPAAGSVSATIRTFAPAFDAPVVLRIGGGSSPSGPGFESTVALHLRVSTVVAVWRTNLRTEANTTTFLIDGYGPLSAGQLDLRLIADDGRVLASGSTTTLVETGRPGSAGGRLVGLGSFTARLSVAGPIPAGALTVSLTWHDGPHGISHEIRQAARDSSKPGALP